MVGLAAAVRWSSLGWLAIARCDDFAPDDPSSGHYFRQQIVWSALGLAAMTAMSLLNYRVLCRWSYLLFLASLGLLVVAFFFRPIHEPIAGFASVRSAFNRPSSPRWPLCWRSRDT